MKNIEPKRQYNVDGGYPSVADVDVSRRGFLGVVVAGGVGLGGVLLLPGLAEAGRRHGRRKVVVRCRYRLRGCKHRIEKLVVQSYDPRLIAFLSTTKERSGVCTALRAVLKRYECRDLHNAKRLSAMQRALGKALSARYRKRTRRRAKRPTVTIIAGRPRPRPPVDGGLRRPSVPVPVP